MERFFSSVVFFICLVFGVHAYAERSCCTCWYSELDFLYWQANMGDTALSVRAPTAIHPSSDPNITKLVETNGRLIDPGSDGKWSPGVRAAIGFDAPCAPWEYELSGIYYNSKSIVSENPPGTTSSSSFDYVAPLLNVPAMGNGALSFDGFWELDFVVADLVAARSFCFCNVATLATFFGFRGAWIQQNLQANYHNAFFFVPEGSQLDIPLTQSKEKTSFWGVGITTGVDFEAPLFCCISCVGSVGGSLLYGKVNVTDIIHGYHAEPNPNAPPEYILGQLDANFNAEKYVVRANLEADIGLAYQIRPNIEITACYFLGVWFDQNDFISYFNSASTITLENISTNSVIEDKHGNLQLSGLMLGLSYAF